MDHHYTQGTCQVLPHKASPVSMTWATADNVQGVHSDSTLCLAPSTPMQASVAWCKTHASPESLPPLSLGGVSSEMDASTPIPSFSSRPAAAGTLSAPSKLYGRLSIEIQREGDEYHKDNVLSFSLATHEKNYQAGHKSGLGTPLGNRGVSHPSPLYMQAAPGGSVSEMCSSSSWHSFVSHKDMLNFGPKVLMDKNPPQLGRSAEQFCNAPALSFQDMQDSRSYFDLSNAASSPPGEDAKNAYKLYSETFASTGATITGSLPSPPQSKGCFHTQPDLEHMDVIQLLPAMFCDEQATPKGRSTNNNNHIESGKKLKSMVGTPQNLVVVKQEPDVEADTRSCPEISLSQPSARVENKVGKAPAHHSSVSMEADWGKFLALSAVPVAKPTEAVTTSCVLPFQKRFQDLQAFLKQCDEADPSEGVQALRSLSAEARSGYAVKLETRAIRLSLEEGKEMKRMKSLNVLDRNPDRSLDDMGATPQGPRLPAPGCISDVKNVV